jgi:phage gpG-like protein
MYTIQVKTTPETKRFLRDFPKEFHAALLKGVKKSILFAEAESKKSFGKPGNLKVRSGHLRRSIRSNVRDRYREIVAELNTDVKYGAIHEYGGVIKAKHAPYLKFTVGGRWVQVKQVTIPARPFLAPAIENNLLKLEQIITNTVEQEISR